jgi:nitrogen fixation protein NifX
MSGQQPLTRELALRIGLAARVLPDANAKDLLDLLADCIGLPLTEEKMADISLQQFQSAYVTRFSKSDESALTQALQLLKTDPDIQATPLQTAIYQDGDMPGSVRIACASNDGVNVDGHFGSCSQFLVYQVSADEIRLIDARATDIPAGLEVDDKNVYRAELIQDCQVLYVASVGGPAAAKIVKLNIHPMKLPSIESIGNIIQQLQQVIAGTPPPWLAKIMGIEASDRFRFKREATG